MLLQTLIVYWNWENSKRKKIDVYRICQSSESTKIYYVWIQTIWSKYCLNSQRVDIKLLTQVQVLLIFNFLTRSTDSLPLFINEQIGPQFYVQWHSPF